MRPIITRSEDAAAPDPLRPLWRVDRNQRRVPAWRVFDELAPWYAHYRPGYPDAAITYLAAEAGLNATSRVLDLGCGPGRLAIALAPAVSEVVALDPAPRMLYQAVRLAARAGVGHRIHWREARADEVGAIGPGPFDLAVIASASAFIDLAAVLNAIAPLMSPDGTVAVLSAEPALQPAPSRWQQAAHRVRARWFAPLAPRSRQAAPDITEALHGSPFGHTRARRFTQVLELNLDQAVGLQYTYASCNPRTLGGDWAAFETELRRALTASCPDGRFPLEHRTDTILATRLTAAER